MSKFIAAFVAVVILMAGVAPAAVIVNDNFDSYADQSAFDAVWLPVGTTTTASLKGAQLSTAQASSAPNSAFIPVSTSATTSATEYRSRRTHAETGALTIGNQLVWSFDYFDTSATGNPQRNAAVLQDGASTGNNQLISMGLNNNQLNTASGGAYYMARILGYTPTTNADPDGGAVEGGTLGAGAYFKLNDFGAPHRTNGWHNLKVILSTDDGVATDYAFYVDNVLAERVSNIGAAGTLRSYDNITLGLGLTNGGVTSAYDNQILETVVPEPTSLALVGLVGLLLRRRRVA